MNRDDNTPVLFENGAGDGEDTAENPVQPTTWGDCAPYGVTYRQGQPNREERAPRKKLSSAAKGWIGVLVSLCIVVGAVAVPLANGKLKSFWFRANGGEVKYPCVLVHGLGGWGESGSMASVAPYWGATTGSLADYLRGEGYEVAVPTVGPYSSTWDRTCELYAQLTGTQVDYGAAHSQAHHHERFGRTYDAPLVAHWGQKENGGQRVKINLIGHSFGGATVRMLAWLLATGNEAEQKATGKETSPLFTGEKEDWVFSVTTLCAPHNGSQLTEIADDLGGIAGIDGTTSLLVSLLIKACGDSVGKADYMLDQFGITNTAGDERGLTDAVKTLIGSHKDNAIYELSPDGAAELNQTVKTAEGIYYFSYAYSTMRGKGLLGKNAPTATTLPVLMLTAYGLGNYTGTTRGGIVIDESWQDNDGLVSVVSAQYPTGEKHQSLPEAKTDLQTGIWYVTPTGEGDHGTVIGLNAPTEQTHTFFDRLLTMLAGLKR